MYNRNVFWVPKGAIGPYAGGGFFENDPLEKGWYFFLDFGKNYNGPYKTEQMAINEFGAYHTNESDLNEDYPEIDYDGRAN